MFNAAGHNPSSKRSRHRLSCSPKNEMCRSRGASPLCHGAHQAVPLSHNCVLQSLFTDVNTTAAWKWPCRLLQQQGWEDKFGLEHQCFIHYLSAQSNSRYSSTPDTCWALRLLGGSPSSFSLPRYIFSSWFQQRVSLAQFQQNCSQMSALISSPHKEERERTARLHCTSARGRIHSTAPCSTIWVWQS